jgi:hypothetical protein
MSSTILAMCFCRSIKLFSSSKRSATSVPFFSGWYPTCFLSTGRCVGRIILLALMYEAVPLVSCDVHSPGCSLFSYHRTACLQVQVLLVLKLDKCYHH